MFVYLIAVDRFHVLHEVAQKPVQLPESFWTAIKSAGNDVSGGFPGPAVIMVTSRDRPKPPRGNDVCSDSGHRNLIVAAAESILEDLEDKALAGTSAELSLL